MARANVSHDKLFRAVFEHFLGDLLELVYPALAAELDLKSVKSVGKKLFADFRKQGHLEPDLVVETAASRKEPRLVLIHVETERRFRNTIDERMCDYGMHLMLKSGKTVVSIAVFLKGGPPGVEIREVRRKVGPFEPLCFRYVAFGLSRSLAEEYVDRPQPLAGALAALMRSEVWDKVERKLRCLQSIQRARDLDLGRRYVLAKVVNTYVELDASEEERFAAELEKEKNTEVREMAVTWEEALAESRAEGRTEGRDEGRDEGRTEGRTEGAIIATQETILRLARRLVSKLPPAFEARIRAVDRLERLHSILDQIVEVDSIEKVDLGK